jgi:hypothetical protein
MSARAAMADDLALDAGSPTKTFVLETHTDRPGTYLADLAGADNVEPTDDAFLFRVRTEHGRFWVDQLNGRFWSFHTDMRSDQAAATIGGWVASRRDLDWMWLPSEHLRHVWPGATTRRVRTDFRGGALIGAEGADTEDLRLQLSGRDAEKLLDLISTTEFRSAVSFDGVQTYLADSDFGEASEAVNRMGKFAVSGDSFELHQQFVNLVVSRYSALVSLCEQKAIRWESLHSMEGGGRVGGGPIVIKFSRPITDQAAFLYEVFSSRVPFRLWGIPQVSYDGVAEIEAVDLHVGQRLGIDVGEDWMRIYLQAGGCGNTVARLVSNLQHRFDGALSMVDPELDAAVGRHLART